MKFQAIEIPVNKHQTRRKTTVKIAPLIAVAIVLFTIIPIYYPLLIFPQNNTTTTSQSFYSYLSFQKILRHSPDTRPVEGLHNPPNRNFLAGTVDVSREPPSRGGHDIDNLVVQQYPRNDVEKPSTIAPNPSHGHLVSPSASPSDHDNVVIKQNPSSWDVTKNRRSRQDESEKKCDIFSGNWVPNPEAPYYSNNTCWAIQEHQNCMKFGRPDTEFMKWKWKPDECELPIFDPIQFLELVRGKSMAFVGDSVARNHMQSLICLLSKVEYPIDVSNSPEPQNKRYEYKNYNFTVAIFWSPYLVRTTKTDPNDTTLTRPFNLFLDELDTEWTNQIEDFDYVIISAGHWFFRPSMFHVKRRLAGCLYCQQTNVTNLPVSFSYRRAFRTAFRGINRLKKYKGTTFLRSFAPSHYEEGAWNEGGDCERTRPFRRNETKLKEYNLELYMIQVKEIGIAERVGRKRGLKFRLIDVTKAMLLRPDGHPSRYGRLPIANVSLNNDCVHWCLPGPIDTWNDFLLNMLKMEER